MNGTTRYFWLVWLLCWMGVAVASPAQESPSLTVRVVDIANGRPVRNYSFRIYKIDPETARPIVERGLPLEGTTDADGKISFPIAPLYFVSATEQHRSGGEKQVSQRKRLSKFLDLLVVSDGGEVECSRNLFSLDEILSSGVVADNRCNEKFDPTKFKSVPGEVIVFFRKYHWWENTDTLD